MANSWYSMLRLTPLKVSNRMSSKLAVKKIPFGSPVFPLISLLPKHSRDISRHALFFLSEGMSEFS